MKRMTFRVLFAVGLCAIVSQAWAGAGVKAVYQVSADELWQTIEFHQPSENIMPPIASSKLSGNGNGATKINQLKGGGEVHLKLVYYSPENQSFNYIIESSPLPVGNYLGEVRVRSLGANRSQLSWHGIYEPVGVPREKADEILQGFYEAIVGRIGEIHLME
ncbi:SRPBCC family protein [Gammaproteobacteria bacterium]|nr:SRPBCC family protein [Gammaproteobacteria bacterium]